jgi:hypothetical protein
MKKVRLTRITEYADATFGALTVNGKPICVTLEDAWKENKTSISCIPKGKYKLTWHNSPRFGQCYLVNDVPNRSHILIHAGNSAADTHGCILLGLMFGDSRIVSSRAAIDLFHSAMKQEPGELEVL